MMNTNDEYEQIQRRLCAVMAKSEWTSSLMRMQKSGEEFRESRTKSNQTANKFLQDLLKRRTDNDLLDDNGALDRYNKFLRYKSAFDDDANGTLDEFHRRLCTLNQNRKSQTNKLNNQSFNTFIENDCQSLSRSNLQSTIDIENDKNEIKTSQIHLDERFVFPTVLTQSVSIAPITSTPNDTTNEIKSPVFHVHNGDDDDDDDDDDAMRELSNARSDSISFIDSQANHIESPIDEQYSSPIKRADTLSSLTSPLEKSQVQILQVPKPLRPDGVEFVYSPPKNPLTSTSSNDSVFHHCYFPRSLRTRANINATPPLKRQLPSLPTVQLSEDKQIEPSQIYDLLNYLESNSSECSTDNFTKILDQLTLTTVTVHTNNNHNYEQINTNTSSIEDTSFLSHEEEENIFPNLFDHSFSSQYDKKYYTTLIINIGNSNDLSLYTMTFSTVQLTESIILPYSILNGRRPFLKGSNKIFRKINSKQPNRTYHVTAIESCSNLKQLQQNDIILKINDRPVLGLDINEILNIFKQNNKGHKSCSLTVVRLCQPFA